MQVPRRPLIQTTRKGPGKRKHQLLWFAAIMILGSFIIVQQDVAKMSRGQETATVHLSDDFSKNDTASFLVEHPPVQVQTVNAPALFASRQSTSGGQENNERETKILHDLTLRAADPALLDTAFESVFEQVNITDDGSLRLNLEAYFRDNGTRADFHSVAAIRENKIPDLSTPDAGVWRDSLIIFLGDSTTREFLKIFFPASSGRRNNAIESGDGKRFTLWIYKEYNLGMFYAEIGKWRLWESGNLHRWHDVMVRLRSEVERQLGHLKHVVMYTNMDGLHRLHLGKLRPYESTIRGSHNYAATLRRLASISELIFAEWARPTGNNVEILLGTVNDICDSKYTGEWNTAVNSLDGRARAVVHCRQYHKNLPAAKHICGLATLSHTGTMWLNLLAREIVLMDPSIHIVDVGSATENRCNATSDGRHYAPAVVRQQITLIAHRILLLRVEAILSGYKGLELASKDVQNDPRFRNKTSAVPGFWGSAV